ncbi:GntR family transcriptional regulator [Bacillus licheniformis]|nr:GntR family transcriptional regulator [Bacillus licheniformis]
MVVTYTTENKKEKTIAEARKRLSSADRPTAIFCYNDEIALIVLDVVREFGLKVPDDISIVGYLMINQLYQELNPPHFILDDEHGGFIATEHLIKLGHEKVFGFFKQDDMQGVNRMKGFIRAFRENGLSIESSLSSAGYTLVVASTNNDIEKEKQCLVNMLDKKIDGLIVEPTKTGSFNPNLNYYLTLEQHHIPYFDVSRHTIRQAIGDLVHEGLLYREQGSGTYCSHRLQLSEKGRERNKMIGVITTYLSDYIFPSIIRGPSNM